MNQSNTKESFFIPRIHWGIIPFGIRYSSKLFVFLHSHDFPLVPCPLIPFNSIPLAP